MDAYEIERYMLYMDYCIAKEDYRTGLEVGEIARWKRQACPEMWEKLEILYEKNGDMERAAFYCALQIREQQAKNPMHPIPIPTKYHRYIRPLVVAANSLPMVYDIINDDGTLYFSPICHPKLGLSPLRIDPEEFEYWVGLTTPVTLYVGTDVVLHDMMTSSVYELANRGFGSMVLWHHFIYTAQRAKETSEFTVNSDSEQNYVLPITATDGGQTIELSVGGQTYEFSLIKAAYRFFRLSKSVHISSAKPFAVGKPIVLTHNKNRKKAVINIFADALCWQRVKESSYKLVPNIMNFFRKGIIFDNHYSSAEYTLASSPALETGCHTHKTQIFQNKSLVWLNPNYLTISEQMNRLGYYCASPLGNFHCMNNGIWRGFDYYNLQLNHIQAAQSVERLICHLDAFSECDTYAFIYMSDPHVWSTNRVWPDYAYIKLPAELWHKEIDSGEDYKSVRFPPGKVCQTVNLQSIRDMDRSLGELFNYIEDTYDEDEYVIHLYSDHGLSIWSDDKFIVGEYLTHAAMMTRGAGVPSLGIVDELTSGVDLYKVVGHNAGYPIDAPYLDGNLPAALGGREREYVYSQSIYPGQTYKLCIRNKAHEFRLESAEFTRPDGTVNMKDYKCGIYTRNKAHLPVYDEVAERKFMHLAYEFTKTFATWDA